MAGHAENVPGELFVKLRPEVLARILARVPPKGSASRVTRVGLESIDALLAPFAVRRISRVVESILLIEMAPDTDLARVRDLLLQDPQVEAVEVNYLARTE